MPKMFSDPEAIAEDIIRDAGTEPVVGLPLGLGKANQIVNALYARAAADRAIRSHLLFRADAGKTEASEPAGAALHRPVIDRLFGGYPDLAYADALHARRFRPISASSSFSFWPEGGCMCRSRSSIIFPQIIPMPRHICWRAGSTSSPSWWRNAWSTACALQPELQHRHHAGILRARAEGRASFKLVGQVDSELPFMPGAGDLPAEQFSAVLDSPKTEFPLFAPPSEPITDTKYAIGLRAAGLIRDGGTLQIGIGQVGDALAQGLIVRHCDNAQFHEIMKRLAPATERRPAPETGPFEQGLYGVSEMLFEAFLGLIDAGILKREVDGVLLQARFFSDRNHSIVHCAR